jgi:hypothetical protein
VCQLCSSATTRSDYGLSLLLLLLLLQDMHKAKSTPMLAAQAGSTPPQDSRGATGEH